MDLKRVSRAAHDHAATIEKQLADRHPGCWEHMEMLRRQRPVAWPDWCLLPMAGAVAADVPPMGDIATLAAVYAWRYSRSVYLIHPDLIHRLLDTIPDVISLDDLTGLPEWCVYLTTPDQPDQPDQPTSGLWMHLEHDANTGRPELRLLLDMPAHGALVPIPVYLDRDTLTEALGDYRATALRTLVAGGTGHDVRGGDLDASVADLADRVERYVAVAAYLARPQADITSLERPGQHPRRLRSPATGRSTWLVGYTDHP